MPPSMLRTKNKTTEYTKLGVKRLCDSAAAEGTSDLLACPCPGAGLHVAPGRSATLPAKASRDCLLRFTWNL